MGRDKQNVARNNGVLGTLLGNKDIKSGGFNATALYQLPILDTTKMWTDHELYDLFELTEEEIKLVQEYKKI